MLKVVSKKIRKNKTSHLDVINSTGKRLILYWTSDKHVSTYYLNRSISMRFGKLNIQQN